MNIKSVFLFLFVLLIAAPSGVFADHSPEHNHTQGLTNSSLGGPIEVQPNEVVLETLGIVCSFCAYGTERNLKKLEFVNTSSKEGKAIHTEIETGRISLPVFSDQPIDLGRMASSIEKAGYELTGIHLNLSGLLRKEDDRYFLKQPDSGQTFELQGEVLNELESEASIQVQAHVNPEQISLLKKGQAYQLLVDTLEVLS